MVNASMDLKAGTWPRSGFMTASGQIRGHLREIPRIPSLRGTISPTGASTTVRSDRKNFHYPVDV
jgi:hypothetical protein